ncbi:MAG: hypothetical protein LLF76_12865 [Planctomycetaceae bacterium]|nr:hypothetical protein [Planctomycetaceae bacterium]
MAAAFIFFKENRCRKALLLLLPLIVVKLSWFGFAKLSGMAAQSNILFTSVVNTLLISFSLVWMLAERLARVNRFARLLLETAVFCLVGAASINQLGFGYESIIVAVLCIVMWSIILSAFSVGRFMCRRRFGAIRFCAWAAVWILVTLPLLLMTMAAVQDLDVLVRLIWNILGMATIFAGIATAGLVPFEILLFANSFWRKRFEKLVGIQTKPRSKDVVDPVTYVPSTSKAN